MVGREIIYLPRASSVSEMLASSRLVSLDASSLPIGLASGSCDERTFGDAPGNEHDDEKDGEPSVGMESWEFKTLDVLRERMRPGRSLGERRSLLESPYRSAVLRR